MHDSTIDVEAYENALFDLSRHLFARILVRDARDDELWARRIKTFEYNGLLSFLVPSPFTAPALEVDHSRLEDPRYRRHLVRRLKAPRPSKHVSLHVAIKREDLATPEYVCDISKLLAYKWVSKLLPDTGWLDKLLLLKQDERALTLALDTMRMHESDGKSVARLILRRMTEAVLDGNERLKETVAALKAETGKVVSEFSASISASSRSILEEAHSAIARITADAAKKSDAYLEEIRRDSEAACARTERMLAEYAPDPDPDASFRRAVLERERERMRAHRWSNRLWCAFFVLIFVVLALHAEIGDFRAIDWLTDLVWRLPALN